MSVMKNNNSYYLLCLFFFLNIYSAIAGKPEWSNRLYTQNFSAGKTIKVKDPFRASNYSSVTYSSYVSLVYGREAQSDVATATTFPNLQINYAIDYFDENQ